MKWVKLILLGLPLCLCSCATVTNTLDTVTDALYSLKPEKTFYYSGVDNMKLYSAPNYNTPPSAKVPLNEELILLKSRYRWAFVEVAKTGCTGWVEKTYLGKKSVKQKKSLKVKKSTQKGQGAKKATAPKSEEKAEKGILDIFGPKSAIAAPPAQEKGKPTKPQTEADVFDAF